MNQQTLLVTFGCLLHDVGKVVCRAGAASGDHGPAGADWLKPLLAGEASRPVLDCVRYHHADALDQAELPADSIAYIAYLADKVSAAADRREAAPEDSQPDRVPPLSPVFTHLNGQHPGYARLLQEQDGSLQMPSEQGAVQTGTAEYSTILLGLKKELSALSIGPEWADSLLCGLERWTSAVPASILTGDPDISLFDHLKISAAVGSCISEYVLASGATDYRTALFEGEPAFQQEKVFLLYSADFSGIQKFIYTVSTKNALRSLRSRSFFLELAMEHYIDELLSGCGVSRANLLYSGGGHCYLLLPNTQSVKEVLTGWNQRFNEWLMEQFGISLYLADGWTPCSANDLTNTPARESPYKAMFHRVSGAIAKRKLSRYSASQIRALNHGYWDTTGRECRICGRSDHLVKDREGDTYSCRWCSLFEALSGKVFQKDVFLVTAASDANVDFQLPAREGTAGFILTDEKTARARLQRSQPIVRIYTKNKAYSGMNSSIRIYVGDYAYSSQMEELAQASEGIRRLAVCRMDVDDLGQAFVAGFEQADAASVEEQQRFITLSRTAAFSRQMSLFFRCYINPLLKGEYGGTSQLHVTIVYSGGDDVFLVGAWTDVIEAASRIRTAFREFTCGTLTISCGIGLFQDHYPIRLAANQTAELEEASKALPEKDAITLFAAGQSHTYPWQIFADEVLGKKLSTLQAFFQESGQTERGNAFLYRLTSLLQEAQADPKNRIQLARYAYLLARLEPSKKNSAWRHYRTFADHMYAWALSKKDRGQLITAIYIYVYRNRKEQ